MRPVVLYDRDCNFCATVAAGLAAWDRHHRVRFATIQGSVGEEHLADLTHEARLASVHFVDAGGRRSSGGAALAPLLDRLPGAAPLGAALRRFPGPTDRGYRWVAGHRVGISRWVPSRLKRRGRRTLERRERAGG